MDDEALPRDMLVLMVELLKDSFMTCLLDLNNPLWDNMLIQTVQVMTARLCRSLSLLMGKYSISHREMCAFRLRHVAKMLLQTTSPESLWGPRQLTTLQGIHLGTFNLYYGDPETGIFRVRTQIDRRIGWTTLITHLIQKMQECFPSQVIHVLDLTRRYFKEFGVSQMRVIPVGFGDPKRLLAYIHANKSSQFSIPIVLFNHPLGLLVECMTNSDYKLMREQIQEVRQHLTDSKMILVY